MESKAEANLIRAEGELNEMTGGDILQVQGKIGWALLFMFKALIQQLSSIQDEIHNLRGVIAK